MTFTDYLFLPILLLFFLIYFVLPAGVQWVFLLLASVAFYCTWGIVSLPYIAVAIVVAWLAGVWMGHRQDKTTEDNKAKIKFQCKCILFGAVLIILGMLIYTKALRLGEGLIIPLGISYYSMSLIGYLADVYWKKEKAEKNPAKLALYAIYFPKILEGPISKHRNVAEQLTCRHKFDYSKFCFGLQRVLWGYFKKLVIADRLGVFVEKVFGEYDTAQGSTLLLAAIFGAFQLYCDFSGCMDIALGISECLGITLEENFNRPFFSQSAAEFWRRWHITLGTWFKDYIYMPLAVSPRLMKISGKLRNACGKRAAKTFMTVIPLAVVWTLTGVWHGTGWNYIIWGFYWGLLIILSASFEPEIKKLTKALHIDTKSNWFVVFARCRTFLLFVISRIITIPSDIGISRTICRRIFFNWGPWQLSDGFLLKQGLEASQFMLAIFLILFLLIVEKKQEDGVKIREEIAACPLILRWMIYLLGIFAVLVLGAYGYGFNASSFVYMNY